jgi:hypothetical protein
MEEFEDVEFLNRTRPMFQSKRKTRGGVGGFRKHVPRKSWTFSIGLVQCSNQNVKPGWGGGGILNTNLAKKLGFFPKKFQKFTGE